MNPLAINRAERALLRADANRERVVSVDADTLRELLKVAREPKGGGYTISYPISVTAPTMQGDSYVTPFKPFCGTKDV